MDQQKEKPLEGIKVVEYGVFHAGPGGGAILGDLGAESLLGILQAPVEKTGRMLLLEDTISSLSNLMNK